MLMKHPVTFAKVLSTFSFYLDYSLSTSFPFIPLNHNLLISLRADSRRK